MDFFAAAAFALESVAAQELKMLNMKNVRIEANRVFFREMKRMRLGHACFSEVWIASFF